MNKCPNCGTAIGFIKARFLAKGNIVSCNKCGGRLRARGSNKPWTVLLSMGIGVISLGITAFVSFDAAFWYVMAGFCLALVVSMRLMEAWSMHVEILPATEHESHPYSAGPVAPAIAEQSVESSPELLTIES